MDPIEIRPIPRWLHVWAIVTVAVSAILLLFGESVTTLRAGMADPEWPTRPWHLALDSKERWTAGYVVEHTHRILGFLVGGLVLILAIGAWAYESSKPIRWMAIISIAALLGAFGWFHVQMMAQKDLPFVGLPIPSVSATLVTLIAVAAVCVMGFRRNNSGTGVRVLSVVALVFVMLQGLLGGLRVKLDQLVGTELSVIHGTFATLVFALLLSVPALSAAAPTEPLREASRRKLNWLTTSLVVFGLLQISFGAWVRHAPDKMSSRLHLLFAFVVVGFATLAIKQALADPIARRRLNCPARILMALITLQILFGVEAWMGKFMTGVPLDSAKAPPIEQSIIRTAHAHIGAWILAIAVLFAIRVRRKAACEIGPLAQPFVNQRDAEKPAKVGR